MHVYLDTAKHASLKILSRNVTELDIQTFLQQAKKTTTSEDRRNIDSILQVSVSANQAVYEKIRKEQLNMCEALRILMKDEIDAAINKAVNEAVLVAEKRKAKETAFSLANMGLPLEQIAQAIKCSIDEVQLWIEAGNKES